MSAGSTAPNGSANWSAVAERAGVTLDEDDRVAVVWRNPTYPSDIGMEIVPWLCVNDGDYDGPDYAGAMWRSLMDCPVVAGSGEDSPNGKLIEHGGPSAPASTGEVNPP